jgi:hypothetical protein
MKPATLAKTGAEAKQRIARPLDSPDIKRIPSEKD